MNFIADQIVRYAESCTTREGDVLQSLNRETNDHVFLPGMLSGHLQGRFLSFISRMLRPRLILDIGTYTGYSALSLAEGLAGNGKLITIDYNGELEEIVNRYVGRAGLEKHIEMRVGDAAQIIPQLEGTFDLVYIDADKKSYLKYYQLVLPRLSPGGIIIVDNVLWEGKVADEKYTDKETLNMRAFNEYVTNDPTVFHVLLPVRDGLMLIMPV